MRMDKVKSIQEIEGGELPAVFNLDVKRHVLITTPRTRQACAVHARACAPGEYPGAH